MKATTSIAHYKQSSVLYLLMVFIASFTGLDVSAQQYSLRLVVKSAAATKKADTVYVAGNFNAWNPGNEKFQLTRPSEFNDVFTIEISGLKADTYEFKFTRGDWGRVEVSSSGAGISNRVVNLTSDSTIECEIADWQDNFLVPERLHTASLQVHVLDTVFFIPELNRAARVWIYLPKAYSGAKNKKRYPVLYMNDGQNVFDEYFSGYGEWGIDECLDSLVENGKPPCIVVAVEAGAKRINEYNPYNTEKYGIGEGDKYVDFLVKTLKPFIDKRYRTLKSADNTLIAGSSLGGLISYYALLAHPEIFGKAGVFSPSFWIAPQINTLTDSVGKDIRGKIFFYMGQAEGNSYVKDMKEIADNIGKRSDAIIYTVIDPDGRHNEQAWRKWFAEFYCWMMGDGFNNQVTIEK